MDLEGTNSFRPRQLIALVALIVLGAVLVPTGVNAAASLFRLQDADSSVLAQVDAGKLRVGDGGGGLTVDGNVGISAQQSTVQTGAREPISGFDSFSMVHGASNVAGELLLVVPAGKRLILETLSARAILGDGQRSSLRFSFVDATGGSTIATFALPLVFDFEDAIARDFYSGLADVHGYAPPGAGLYFNGSRWPDTGTAAFQVTWTGHLVPA